MTNQGPSIGTVPAGGKARLKKAIVFFLTLTAGAIAGVIATQLWDDHQRDVSAADPLAVKVESLLSADNPPLRLGDAQSTLSDPKGLSFQLVVPDRAKLPQGLPPRPTMPGEDCKMLWRIGIESGGQPPTTSRQKITFTNKYSGGEVSIVELQAKALDSSKPASDGALLECGVRGMGMEKDPSFACDLVASNPAICKVEDGPLSKVGRLTVAKEGQASLQVSVNLPPGNSVDWVFEAKVTVGSQEQWVRINSDNTTGSQGKPFTSLGLRDGSANQRYAEYIWSVSLAIPVPIPGLDAGWRRGNTEPPMTPGPKPAAEVPQPHS